MVEELAAVGARIAVDEHAELLVGAAGVELAEEEVEVHLRVRARAAREQLAGDFRAQGGIACGRGRAVGSERPVIDCASIRRVAEQDARHRAAPGKHHEIVLLERADGADRGELAHERTPLVLRLASRSRASISRARGLVSRKLLKTSLPETCAGSLSARSIDRVMVARR